MLTVFSYIKELADRLNSLESQIHHPPNPTHTFDFGSMGDQTFQDTQSPPQFKRQRTHSMTEGFHEAFSRPNWTVPDRGNDAHGMSGLGDQESSLNGNRRTSFGDMNLGGSLITGSNEETLKAYVCLNALETMYTDFPDTITLYTRRCQSCPTMSRS